MSFPSSRTQLASLICWETDALGGVESPSGDKLDATFYYSLEQDPCNIETQIRAVCQIAGVAPGSIEQNLVRAPPGRWMSSFRDHFKGVTVGRFFIHPPWIAGQPGQINLQIDPSHAFGTGTHESTQLILQGLPGAVKGVGQLLDVGTGSGILAIAARLLSPGIKIWAIDDDPDAAVAVARNALANQAPLHLSIGGPGSVSARFDLVIANLTGPLLRNLSGELTRVTRRRLIVSGFTTDENLLVKETFLRGRQWALSQRREKRGWMSFQLDRI